MKRASLLIIFLIVFVDLVGFGIVIPILPYYARAFGASAWQLGWLMTSYSLMQFLVAPLWGRLSDRIGRRPVLIASLIGTCLSMTVLGLAHSLAWLFIARTAAGIFGANISTAYAYVADVTDEENRAKGMGMVGAAFGLGFIFGPAIGGVLSRYGYAAPMFAGAALAAANTIFALAKLAEPPLAAEVRASHRTRRFDLTVIRQALGDPRSRLAIGVFLLVTMAVTQMEVIFAIYLKAFFGYEAQSAGLLLALMGIVMVGMQGGLIGRLVKAYGELKLILAGTLICAVALVGFGLATAIPVLVTALVFLALGHGMLHPSLSSLASKGATPTTRGATMGVFQSAGSLARVLGPPCAGFLYDSVGPAFPFYGGSVLLVAAFSVMALAAGRLESRAQAASALNLNR